MERVYRASNGVFLYAAFLALDAVVLAIEGVRRLRAAAPVSGALLVVAAILFATLAVYLGWFVGRLRIVITHDSLIVRGERPVRRMHWADVDRVREITGPPYQLSLKRLLPGPFLPHGLFRGETVLEVLARPAMRIVVRRSLVEGYDALRQDVLRATPKDTEVDLHSRWWRD